MQVLLFLILLAVVITYWYVFAAIIGGVLLVWIVGKTTVAIYRGVAADPARFGMAKPRSRRQPESNHLHWKAKGDSTALWKAYRDEKAPKVVSGHRTVVEQQRLGSLNARHKVPDSAVRAVPPVPPSLRWPMFWTLWTAAWVAWWLWLTVTESIDFAPWLAFSLGLLAMDVVWYRRRVADRAEWRQARRVEWFFGPPLKGPEATDWEKYEAELNPEWS